MNVADRPWVSNVYIYRFESVKTLILKYSGRVCIYFDKITNLRRNSGVKAHNKKLNTKSM